ncbi:hypothetical protein BGX38DRAFT_1218050, partial [Terfezia claveryi]
MTALTITIFLFFYYRLVASGSRVHQSSNWSALYMSGFPCIIFVRYIYRCMIMHHPLI